MRKKIIAGNWKMNNTITEAAELVNSIKDGINTDEVDVVLCPNFVSLSTVSDLIDETKISLGAQNVYFEDKGAYTGETSVDMLISAGVKYCIVGHSERRAYFNETDEIVNKKVKKLLEKDLNVLLDGVEERKTYICKLNEIYQNGNEFQLWRSCICNCSKYIFAIFTRNTNSIIS